MIVKMIQIPSRAPCKYNLTYSFLNVIETSAQNGSGGSPGTVPVFMTMEISPQHHDTVLGKGNINLKIIMKRTNTTIIFPDAGDPNIPPIKKGSVTISSKSIHNVYLARQLLLGSLPIVMMFDIPESIAVDETVISKLQENNDVFISIKPKARQSSKSCIIKTQERNSAGNGRGFLIFMFSLAANVRTVRFEACSPAPGPSERTDDKS